MVVCVAVRVSVLVTLTILGMLIIGALVAVGVPVAAGVSPTVGAVRDGGRAVIVAGERPGGIMTGRVSTTDAHRYISRSMGGENKRIAAAPSRG